VNPGSVLTDLEKAVSGVGSASRKSQHEARRTRDRVRENNAQSPQSFQVRKREHSSRSSELRRGGKESKEYIEGCSSEKNSKQEIEKKMPNASNDRAHRGGRRFKKKRRRPRGAKPRSRAGNSPGRRKSVSQHDPMALEKK